AVAPLARSRRAARLPSSSHLTHDSLSSSHCSGDVLSLDYCSLSAGFDTRLVLWLSCSRSRAIGTLTDSCAHYTGATVTPAWSGARPREIPPWLWFSTAWRRYAGDLAPPATARGPHVQGGRTTDPAVPRRPASCATVSRPTCPGGSSDVYVAVHVSQGPRAGRRQQS